MDAGGSDHTELRNLLGRIRRRWLVRAGLATGGRAAAAAALPLGAAGLVAAVLQPSGAVLIALAVVAISAAAAAAVLVVRRMERPDDCQVARFIEERTGQIGVAMPVCEPDAIVSALELVETPDRHSTAFAHLIVANAIAVLRAIEPSAVVPAGVLRRASLEAAAGAALLAVAFVAAGPHLLRAGGTAWIALFPSSIQISVPTGNARVPAGQPLDIDAVVHGRGASWLSIVPSLVVSANGQERTVPMVRTPNGFRYAFESVDRSFQYRVTAGAARSAPYAVTALFPPRVTRIDVRYDYPSFSGLTPRTDENAGDIYGPAGTKVRLIVHTDKPIARGGIALKSGPPLALAASAAAPATAELQLSRDDAYRVMLTDADGLQSSGDVEYFIRLMDDRPPDVRIVRPSGDQTITPLEEVAIEARADDDYGVDSLELVYNVAGRKPQVVPFRRIEGTTVARQAAHLLAAEDLGVQPGDVITYYARARDVGRGKRPTESRSDMFFLEVKPFNEEFVAAQSQAMGGGPQSTQIDALIAQQKEIINATWNLERRSNAGRSADDLKAVGEAQAELKGRLDQMYGGRRSRGAFIPQRIAPQAPPRQAPARDPIAAAAAAMGRAVEQLQTNQSTAEAIPHEMAALQGLLQAQAEVRRRQVMMASNAAGQGGSNRADRDLSALFDRELQRQQQTNYETPPQAGESQESRDSSDVLDRVRELARRQEDLAERQRGLANGTLAEEEKKRQLEQLSREQQELRQQAEALEKQLRSQRAPSSKGSTSGQGDGASGAGEMRSAADQMRNAANEMQRQNAAGAAASGQRAAESLRQIERQIRGGSAEGRQRAAGELQLEAQQIADGQRRVAGEMSRLEKSGPASGANADALRRLASEKEKLADRIDALQHSARQLEREAPGDAGAPFRAAASQIQEQRIGARMRDGAKQLQDLAGSGGRDGKPAAPAGGVADAEQQLARSLDAVADALGGGSRADARQVTEELDRTREMRDRLNRLEQQVRDAEARAAGRQNGRDGQTAQNGEQPGSARGSRAGGGDGGNAQQELQRAQEAYARELQKTRDALGRQQRAGGGGATPEQHEFSQSAPGNEAFKQDFSRWESLRKDVALALDAREAAIAARLASKESDDRLSAGGSERVPERYRPVVSRYFEAIAKSKK